MGASDDKNLLEGSYAKEDNRTLATKRRNEARAGKPALVQSMLKSVKGTHAEAKYVLFDSWFTSPSSVLSTAGLGYHVVARLKNHEKHLYRYEDENISISRIYRANRKRRGRSRYLLSVTVDVRHYDFSETIPAKIVYVREKGKRKNWIALISTDTSLSEDEIIALYGKRWDIEPFHKVLKSYLRLEKEFQMRSYDAMMAHATIVMTRYVMLSLENRENIDWRSVNDGFYVLCQELEDISFTVAFELILAILKRCSSEHLNLSNAQINEFVTYFIADLPSLIKDKLKLSVCES
ncbi:MAG: transposase [Oscillospiraceae bacterium]|nr:transposase [Oscillospiraceae bacterium]